MLFVTKGEGKQCFFVLEKQKNPPPQCAFECGFCLNWLNVKQKIVFRLQNLSLCFWIFEKISNTYRIFFRSIKKSIERKNTERIRTHRIHFISVNYQLSKLSSSSIWMQTWLQAILLEISHWNSGYNRMIIFNPVCYSYHSTINHKRAFVLNEPRHWLCEWSLCLPCRKKRKIGKIIT